MLQAVGGNLPQAQVRAINRTQTTFQGRIAKKVSDEINISQKDARPYIKLGQKATRLNIKAAVDSEGNPIPFMKFRGTKGVASGGVSVMIIKGRRKILRGAFLQRVKAGKGDATHLGVFMRKGPGKFEPSPWIHRGRPIGQPGPETYYTFPKKWGAKYAGKIFELRAVSVKNIVNHHMPELEKEGQELLQKNLMQSISGMIKQKGYVIGE